MRFSKKIKFFSEGVNIPLDKEMIGTCYVSIGEGDDDIPYMVLSLYPHPIWREYAYDIPIPVVDCSLAAIVELTGEKNNCLYEAIKCDEFAKILVTANVEDMNPEDVFNIYHDILAYRHAYIARETSTDIARAVDKYNARKFLNEYRNLIINTNAYGTSEEEKAPYLRFIDGEKGAFSVLREL